MPEDLCAVDLNVERLPLPVRQLPVSPMTPAFANLSDFNVDLFFTEIRMHAAKNMQDNGIIGLDDIVPYEKTLIVRSTPLRSKISSHTWTDD